MEPIALDRLTDLDAVLTEDEILTRHTVRQFVAEKYLPIIGDHFEQHTFPESLIPELGAIEDIRVAVLAGHRAHGARVRAGIRLREPEAPDHLAAGHAGQPVLFLRLGAEAVNGIHAQ